ncbi:conserved hypothetical protein, membrane [Candidatus Magnetomorum sp. HK-1]|nr:conserved hypothetical protein, membrane [Candidatus Magnetomorum sp. HK-1]
MKIIFQPIYFYLMITYTILTGSFVLAIEPDQQINLKIVDRLARIEEGQKAIISEMRTRFEAVDERFEAVDKRFEAVDKRFEAVDKRFEAMLREMNQRFESVDQRFESMLREISQRFESVDKRIDLLSNYIIAMSGMFLSMFLAIIGYAIWDRRTILEKAQKKTEQLIHDHVQQSQQPQQPQQPQLFPINAQEKLNQMMDIMKQMSEKFPEMRTMMQAAHLL